MIQPVIGLSLRYLLNPRFQPTIRVSLTTSQVLRRGHLKSLKLFKNSTAGVGGSTPSLATIIPKNLPKPRCWVPVRSQSALTKCLEGGFRRWMMVNKLGRRDFSSVRSQSAFMAENCG